MKLFALDVSECELPNWWEGLPRVIQVTPGVHGMDFDVVDESINKQVRAIPEVLGNPDMPVGFNVDSMPVGGKVVRLPDSPEDDGDD